MKKDSTYLFIDILHVLISPEVAIQAKEKGFYCISPHRYMPNGVVMGGWAGHSKPDPTEEDIKAYIEDGDTWPLAVTREVLALWLWQEYHLYPYHEPYFTDTEPYLQFKAKIWDQDERKIITLPDCFKEGGLALDKALFAALEKVPS